MESALELKGLLTADTIHFLYEKHFWRTTDILPPGKVFRLLYRNVDAIIRDLKSSSGCGDDFLGLTTMSFESVKETFPTIDISEQPFVIVVAHVIQLKRVNQLLSDVVIAKGYRASSSLQPLPRTYLQYDGDLKELLTSAAINKLFVTHTTENLPCTVETRAWTLLFRNIVSIIREVEDDIKGGFVKILPMTLAHIKEAFPEADVSETQKLYFITVAHQGALQDRPVQKGYVSLDLRKTNNSSPMDLHFE